MTVVLWEKSIHLCLVINFGFNHAKLSNRKFPDFSFGQHAIIELIGTTYVPNQLLSFDPLRRAEYSQFLQFLEVSAYTTSSLTREDIIELNAFLMCHTPRVTLMYLKRFTI